MNDCVFRATDEVKAGRTRYVCMVCNIDHWSRRTDPAKINRNCGTASDAREPEAFNSGQCHHRGDLVRTQLCPTCSGSVKVKVFACALHGECEMANKLKDVKRCGTCSDFAPNAP